jgi:hypothetical protein
MSGGQHPSFLELDRLALGAAAPATTAHVSGCATCREHLEQVRAAPAMPAGLRDRATAPAPADFGLEFPAGWRGFARAWLVGGGLAAVAVLLLLARLRPPGDPPEAAYVGDKGLPSVWIYVKHDADLSLWDGVQPLSAGDRLRLKIDPQGHTHAAMFTQDRRASLPAPVWNGALAPGAVNTLPTAWTLEGPADEHLIVVLAQAPVSPEEARRFVEEGPPKGVWLRMFTLRKTGATGATGATGGPGATGAPRPPP